jgi:4-hydroxy-2-oxoheptanedioate aldolase
MAGTEPDEQGPPTSWRPAHRGLRAALASEPPLLATFLLLPRVEVVEMLALSGFDAVIVDLEHGPASRAELTAVVAAAQGAGLFAIARLGNPSEDEIGRVLDTGVDGLLVPHVSSPSEAEAIVRAGRFPPTGDRSINPYTRGNSYGVDGSAAYREVNGRVALVAMVEGSGALSALEAIGRTPELDGIFVGPVDLSSSLGFPGQPEHPLVVEAVRDVLARIRAGGLAAGVYAPTPEAAARWLDAGAGLVALSADNAMLVRSLTDWAARAKAGTPAEPPPATAVGE